MILPSCWHRAYQSVLLALLLLPLISSADQGTDPTGASGAAGGGDGGAPPSQPSAATLAAAAFGKTNYAIIPIPVPDTKYHQVETLTDAGSVVIGDTDLSNPCNSFCWPSEQILSFNDPRADFYKMRVNRAGYYTQSQGNKTYHLKNIDSDIDQDIILPDRQSAVDALNTKNNFVLPPGAVPTKACYVEEPLEDGGIFICSSQSYNYDISPSLPPLDYPKRYGSDTANEWYYRDSTGKMTLTNKYVQFVESSYPFAFTQVGGMAENSFFCAVGFNEPSPNPWGPYSLFDATGTQVVRLDTMGLHEYNFFDRPSRNGYIIERMKRGVLIYQHPTKKIETLPPIFGSFSEWYSNSEVNDAGDILIKNQFNSDAGADKLIRRFEDPVTHKAILGVRQFNDESLPTGWTNLHLSALANAMTLLEQRALEAQVPSAYPPLPENTPIPRLGGTATKDGKQYPVILLPMEVKEVWSNQIAGVEANGFPDKTGQKEYPYILIGATSGNAFHVKIKLATEIPAAIQNKILFRWVSEGVVGELLPEAGTSSFTDGKTIQLESNFNSGLGVERYLVMAFDENSNGEIDFSEKQILLKTPHIKSGNTSDIPYKFIPINQARYTENKGTLLTWASTAANIGFNNGARHLTAFCNGAVPNFAGSEPTTIKRDESGLSHPVGVAFTPKSNPGDSFEAIISKDHQLSKDLIQSNALRSWLAGEFNAVGDQVRQDIVAARGTGGPDQLLSYSIPATIESMGFGVIDPDLLVCLGRVKLSDMVIEFDADMYGYANNVKIFGKASDLYDFDYGGEELLGIPARKASELQAGFPSLGVGGKVFKTKIDLGGGNPYSNPDITPFTFFPN